MKLTWLKFFVPVAILVCGTMTLVRVSAWAMLVFLGNGEMFASHTNPIEGWKTVADVGCKDGEMSAEISPITNYPEISDDVQKFVNMLPVDQVPDYCGGGTRRWCYWIENMTFYEDGTGQHAVGFQIPHDGTWWGYVLIYDKNNKRVKALRYIQGHYAC